MERLGPLSYLVETADHLLWKRHIDLLRQLSPRKGQEFVDSEDPEPAIEEPGLAVVPTETPPQAELASTPAAGMQPPQETTPEPPVPTTAPPSLASDSGNATADTNPETVTPLARRYPARDHNPPERLGW